MGKMFKVIFTLVVLVSGCMLNPLGLLFRADIDGTTFRAINGSWNETVMQGVTSGQIFAMDVKFSSFVILVGGAIEEKEYSLGLIGPDGFSAAATYLDIGEGKTYMSQSGTLTITSKTDRLTGTFQMTMTGLDDLGGEITLEVTNGEFDLPNAPDLPI